VALARALVLEPRLLLLDEPLSALDRLARREIRSELARLLRELTCATIYVTHQPEEALAFGDRIAVLEAGRVSQQGTRDDLFRHPRSRYVAEFLGINFFRGTVVKREPGALAKVAVAGGELAVVDPGCEGEVTLVVQPREVTLARERPEGTARNVFRGRIEEIVPEPPAGELMRVLVGSTPPLAAEVTRASVESLGLETGEMVHASFKATGVVVVP
jgi:molybdopterin-binding protein